MNSSMRDMSAVSVGVGILGIVVTVIGIAITVISLLEQRQEPKIEKPPNANHIATENNNQRESHSENSNHIAIENDNQRKSTTAENVNRPIVDLSKVEEPKGRTIKNDIRASRKNGLFEITLENAWASINTVHLSGCNVDIPADQKAVLVRFTRRLWSSRQLSWDEQSNLSSIKPTDFLLIDDHARRMEPSCTASPFYAVSESSQTFVYLKPRNSYRLTFRFQKPGLGEAISFDLSGLD